MCKNCNWNSGVTIGTEIIVSTVSDKKIHLCVSAMACFHLLHSGYDTEVIILVYATETMLLYFFYY